MFWGTSSCHLGFRFLILDCLRDLGDVKSFGVVDNLWDCHLSDLKRRKKEESMSTSSLSSHLPSCAPNWFSTSTTAPLVCFPQNSNSCNNGNFRRAKASLCLIIRGATFYISPHIWETWIREYCPNPYSINILYIVNPLINTFIPSLYSEIHLFVHDMYVIVCRRQCYISLYLPLTMTSA